MKRIIHFGFAALLTALLLVPAVAGASPAPPYQFHLAGEPTAAAAGDIYSGTLVLRANEDCLVEGIVLGGAGWQQSATGPLDSYALSAGDQLEVPFEIGCVDPDSPLAVSFRYEDETRETTFDLSPSGVRELLQPAFYRIAPGDNFSQAVLMREPPRYLNDPGAATDKSAAEVTVITGRIMYRSDAEGRPLVASPNSTVTLTAPLAGIGLFTTTDQEGYFSLEVDSEPDVMCLLRAFATNDRASVETATWAEDDYYLNLGVIYPSGGTIDIGTCLPATEKFDAAFHIANMLKQGGDYLDEKLGMSRGQIDVQWPNGDGTYYKDFWEEIYISSDHKWREKVYLHEYGHYWHYRYVLSRDSDYDNGICDNDGFWENVGIVADTGHCMWCEENATVAWKEGIAHFISRICTDEIASNNTWQYVMDSAQIQQLDTYDERCPTPQDPLITEGFFAALLYDFWDSADTGEDLFWGSDLHDVADGWETVIFEIMTESCDAAAGRPGTPETFLRCFREQYPALREDIWEVGKGNGYDFDDRGPSEPTNFVTSHKVGVASPDNTVQVNWDRPYDDWSGVAGYAVQWALSPRMPGPVVDIADVTHLISPPLDPQDWYCSIRAVDRAGNWSDYYATAGPFTIRDAEPADLIPRADPGWDWPLVPRNAADASSSDCQVTGNLPGGGDTWWNAALVNNGDAATTAETMTRVYIDGFAEDEDNVLSLSGGVGTQLRNRGPIEVPGGRHTMRVLLDADEVLAEPGEGNNYWAGQWVWAPPVIEDRLYSDPPAPFNLADGEYFHWQEPYYLNCAGFEVPMQLLAYGAAMYPLDNDLDLDLRMFSSMNTSTVGFDTPLARSERPAGYLDAVIVNPVVAGYADYNVGVYATQEGYFNNYMMQRQVATSLGSVYGSHSVAPWRDEPMVLFDFTPPGPSAGYVSFRLKPNAGTVPLHMAWFDEEFAMGGLLDATEIVTAHPGESAVIQLEQPTTSHGLIAIWREPGVGDLVYPAHALLKYYATLPDLQPSFDAAWHGPLVPRPDTSIGYPYTSVPEPAVLYGDTAGTTCYVNILNDSVAPTPSLDLRFQVDGEAALTFTSLPALGPDATRQFRSGNAINVPGGRHTLGLALDHTESVTEESEENNGYAFQWVWTPSVQPFDAAAVLLDDLPELTGGWSDLSTLSPRYANQRGIRTERFVELPASFGGVIICPDDTTEVDLAVYPPASDAIAGFDVALGQSSFSPGEADFLVFDSAELTAIDRLDVGLKYLEGRNACLYQLVEGEWIANPTKPVRLNGPYALPAGSLMNLHVFQLTGPAQHRFTLEPDGAISADVGMSLHVGDLTSRLDAADLGISWDAGGQNEEFVAVTEAGTKTYALAVWRRGTARLNTAANYSFRISSDITAVDDLPPESAVTCLQRPSPNPFNPRTTIAFELAAEARVELRIHDLRGRPVRTLVSGMRAAGRHEVVWNGDTDDGQRVASGVYFARMKAGEYTRIEKLTLVK